MYGKRFLLFAVLIVFASMLVLTNSLLSSGQDDPRRHVQSQASEIPMVDYEAKPSGARTQQTQQGDADATRKSKGKRHDKEHAVRDLDTGGNSVLAFSHWDANLPALPIGRSALVVVGQVVDAKAFLSNDNTGVYSEFSVSIEQVVKNNNSAPVFHGDLVSTERWGGRVRFPSRRIITYGNRGQGMPSVGQRYLFFLERNPEQYTILTAYELSSGKVYPLDGKDAPGGANSDWAGNAYKGTDESKFLLDVERQVERVGN